MKETGGDRAVLAAVATGAALRLLATVGVQPTIYVDSGEYRGVALLGGERRPWTVPLLYALVGDGTARVVAHALLGAVAWGALALTLAEVLRHPKVRVAAAAVVMVLGLVGPVANYDATITSETVAISLLVLLVAAWIRLAVHPTVARAAGVVAVSVFFTFTRNDHPMLVTLTALAAVYLAGRYGERAWRVAAAGLLVVSGWGWYAMSQNDEIQRHNLALVIANRVIPDAGATAWFTDRGMPLPSGVEPVVGFVGGDTVGAFDADVEWNEWAAESGTTTYGLWLLTHPTTLFLDPWPDLFGLRNTTLELDQHPVVLLAPIDRYGRMHTVVPEPVEQLVWGGTSAAPVVLAGGWLAVEGYRRREGLRTRLGPVRAVAAAALVVGLGHVLFVWHVSPLELGRLAMVAATTIHVALVVLITVTVDRRVS